MTRDDISELSRDWDEFRAKLRSLNLIKSNEKPLKDFQAVRDIFQFSFQKSALDGYVNNRLEKGKARDRKTSLGTVSEFQVRNKNFIYMSGCAEAEVKSHLQYI